MAKTEDYGLGEYVYPRGWFMIAEATDATTVPKAVRFFGEDMVLYRGEGGTPHLVEAYCPHMGAHLSRNTTSYVVHDGEHVQGDSIRCPFHGWRFGPDGNCDEIPYSEGFIPKAACIKTYPIVERAGIIWMWHDPEQKEADFPLPDFGGHWDEPGWVHWKVDHMGDLNSHPIEIVDNMADVAHFIPIHGSTNISYFANEFMDHVVHQYFSAGHRTLVSEEGQDLVLDTWYEGPSILQSEMVGDYPSFIMIAHTPIEDGLTRVWHCLMVKVNEDSTSFTEEELAAAAQYQEASRLALAQDVEIWQHKRACTQPMVLKFDGPFSRLRKWYSQFYNPVSEAGDLHKKVNGLVATIDKRRKEEVA